MIRRCFAHVGQALFAVERHCEHTIVFDCGGEVKSDAQKAVEDVLKRDEIIDILFVSHYDRDHINGIEYLLQRCTVRHIVLPMLAEPVKTILYRESAVEGNGDVAQFILDPLQVVSEFIHNSSRDNDRTEPRIHFVQPWTEETNRGFDIREEGYSRVNDIDEIGESVAAGVALTINRKTMWCERVCQKPNPHCPCHWIYLPFNRQVMTSDQEQAFWRELGMPEYSKSADVLNRWDDVCRKIKGAWSTATEIEKCDINDYSMTVYAGCCLPNHFNACLFTGDYNAGSYMKELKNAYKTLWDNVRVIQVPHHGSLKNFHEDLIIHHGIHIISNRNQPKNNRQVNDTVVINKFLSRGEYVAKTSLQNIHIPDDYYWEDWHRWDCGFCGCCRDCR